MRRLLPSKLQRSALISAVSLGILEVVAHVRHLTIPMLDQAFIAAIGVLTARGAKKEGSGDKD